MENRLFKRYSLGHGGDHYAYRQDHWNNDGRPWRAGQARRALVLGVVCTIVLGAAMGCGGSGSGEGTNSKATQPGAYTLNPAARQGGVVARECAS